MYFPPANCTCFGGHHNSVLGGGGVQSNNKFEQVSNDGHQMSLTVGVPEGPYVWRVLGLGGRGGGPHVLCLVGVFYSEVQRIMGNGHIRPPPFKENDRQIPAKTLPSHNFVGRWQQVSNEVLLIPVNSNHRANLPKASGKSKLVWDYTWHDKN